VTATREARIAAAMRARERFSEFLRSHRVASDKSLEQISVITKIPERSLRSLEDGKFDALPADVFVRGFLRSYASCLGLEADDVLKRYAACGVDPAPVASEMATTTSAAGWHDDGGGDVTAARPAQPIAIASATMAAASDPVAEASTRAEPAVADAPAAASPAKSRKHGKRTKRTSAPPARATTAAANAEPPVAAASPDAAAAEPRGRAARTTFLPPVGLADGLPRRGPLTLAVVILVVVATLTMSYLLRTPSDGGDGITAAPSARAAIG
jgi:cytoskeletal protein RodZ